LSNPDWSGRIEINTSWDLDTSLRSYSTNLAMEIKKTLELHKERCQRAAAIVIIRLLESL
jgi:hypothetical protein